MSGWHPVLGTAVRTCCETKFNVFVRNEAPEWPTNCDKSEPVAKPTVWRYASIKPPSLTVPHFVLSDESSSSQSTRVVKQVKYCHAKEQCTARKVKSSSEVRHECFLLRLVKHSKTENKGGVNRSYAACDFILDKIDSFRNPTHSHFE